MMHKVVLTVLSILVYPCWARVKYHAQTIPACYIDTSGSARCTHPAYDYCNAGNGGVCCGPDHYCCDSGCCQEFTWNGTEIAAVVMGAIAWTCITAIIVILTLPRILRRFEKYIFLRRKYDQSVREMFSSIKQFFR